MALQLFLSCRSFGGQVVLSSTTARTQHYRMAATGRKCLSKSGSSLGEADTLEGQNSKRTINYEQFISTKSSRRKPSMLRELTKKLSQMPSHTIPFSTGSPNVTTFPFQSLTVGLKDGSQFAVDGKNLEIALQYSPSSGYPKLVSQLQQLQDRVHGPQDWSARSLVPTSGSMEGLYVVCDSVLNEGDLVILPVPVYTGAFDGLRVLNLHYIKLPQDKEGPDPQELRRVLEGKAVRKETMPKLMYVNPIACNPTGRNMSLDRKKQFYQLACDYNFLILEDDPYYFVQFGEETLPSFLSLDQEGRVIRLDSFSKVLSSGLRLGYVTGPAALMRQVELQLQTSSMHPSSLSQVLISLLLDHWGTDRFFTHIAKVKEFYRERKDMMVTSCDRNLKGLCEWSVPEGGMFLWMRVPALRDTLELATKHCLDRFLLIVPGHPFSGQDVPSEYNYVRLSFSSASSTQIEKGTELFAQIIQEVIAKQSSQQ